MIDRLVDAGAPTSTCCRLLGVSRQGYYRYRKRPTSATELRRRWLTRPDPGRSTSPSRGNPYPLPPPSHAELHHRNETLRVQPAHLRPHDSRLNRWPSRPSQNQATQGGRHSGRPGQPQVTQSRAQRAVGHGHHRASHPGGQDLLRRRAGCLQPQDHRLGYRLQTGLHPGRERSGHGNPCTSARARRDRSCGSRSPVHLLGLHSEDPFSGTAAVVRDRRRWPRQCDDGVVLVDDADRAAEPEEVEDAHRASRTRSSSTSRCSTTVVAGTPPSSTRHPTTTTSPAPRGHSPPSEASDQEWKPNRRAGQADT